RIEQEKKQMETDEHESFPQEDEQLKERLFQIEGEKQSLLTQLGQTRQTYALLEEGLQRHDAELSQERIENQTYREQLEKLSQERDQLQEQLSQIQMGKQSLFTQLEQMRQGHTPPQEQIQRLEEQLAQEHRQHQTSLEQI